MFEGPTGLYPYYAQVWGNSRPVGRPAGSSSLLRTPISNGLGLIPLTFCPHTGRINTDTLAKGPSAAANLGLAIFSL